jgi:alpha-ketoglutarate-dependent taurine dioxygenase
MDYIFTSNLLRGICLYAQEVPKAGGHTFFIDLESAYGMLSASMKSRLAGLSAVHIGAPEFTDRTTRRLPNLAASYRSSGGNTENSLHSTWPVVMQHPVTQRPLLFLSPLQTYRIEGMSPNASDALLDDLFTVFESPEIRYDHEWQVGDILVWDNVGLLHGRTAFPPTERRTLRKLEVDAPLPTKSPLTPTRPSHTTV